VTCFLKESAQHAIIMLRALSKDPEDFLFLSCFTAETRKAAILYRSLSCH
jgi:hypothetical protein